MTRVAQWSARGPFAQRVVILKNVTGPHFWTVKLKVTRDNVIDEHTIRSNGRVNLGQMRDFVFESIADLLPEGTEVDDVRMDFFVGGKRP